MKLLTVFCGVLVALAILGTATGQEGEKRTIKRLTMFLIDAKTKGISEQGVTTGTGIKQIEIFKGGCFRSGRGGHVARSLVVAESVFLQQFIHSMWMPSIYTKQYRLNHKLYFGLQITLCHVRDLVGEASW